MQAQCVLALVFHLQSMMLSSSEEWISAIEIMTQQTTPHLQHQQPTPGYHQTGMVTNDDADNTENEYPLMNEVFTRRPVSEPQRANEPFAIVLSL